MDPYNSKIKNYMNLSWYLFLIGPLIVNLYVVPSSENEGFILISLVVLINAQVRKYQLRGKLKLISIIAEVLLILYLNQLYAEFSYLLLFSTLVDTCINLKEEAYPLSAFIGVSLIFSLYQQNSVNLKIIIGIFYAALLMLLLQLKRELAIRTDTEILYDQIRRYTYELEAARARLIDYSKQVEKVAQLEERNRISRELHDSIGHNLTGVLMQVDACINIMEVNKEKGMEILKSVYQNINNSIESVRQTVRQLRPQNFQTNAQAIQELVSKFKQDTGINIELHISGDAYKIPPSVETVLYSNIQEALTNSVRHGKSKNIRIELLYKNSFIEVFISDDGSGASSIKKGFGITGMEERLSFIGGSVSFSGSNGFHIHMTIPRP